MKKIYFFGVLFFALLFAGEIQAETEETQVVFYPTSFGISRPLSEIAAENPYVETSKTGIIKEQPDRANRPPQTFIYTAADGPEYGEDSTTWQTTMGTRDISNRAPLMNWQGQTYTLGRPMDPSGAADDQYYLQAIKTVRHLGFITNRLELRLQRPRTLEIYGVRQQPMQETPSLFMTNLPTAGF